MRRNLKMSKGRNESSSFSEGGFMKYSVTGVSFKKGPWKEAEDEMLLDYIMKHGEGNWSNIHRRTRLLRDGKSCRLRWVNQLRPDLRKGAFTLEEESVIVYLQAKMGNKWAQMTEYLPGRSDNEIKNFWNSRVRKLRRGKSSQHLPGLCSEALPESWQTHAHGMSSSGKNYHHSTVKAIDFDTFYPGFNEEDLPCTPEFLNTFMSGKMMSNTGSLRESPDKFPDAKSSTRSGISSLVNLTENFEKTSHLLNLSTLNHLPASWVKLEPMGFELSSIQNLGTHPGFVEKCYLPYLTIKSFDDFHTSSSPMENILSKTACKSGLLESLIPGFSTLNTAIDTSTATSCCMEGTSSLNPDTMEQKDLLDPILSFGPSVLSCHDFSPTSPDTSSIIKQSSVYTYLGWNESVEQAPVEADIDELSDWLNISGPDESLDVERICEDTICASNSFIDNGAPGMSLFTGNEQIMTTGSCVPNSGQEKGSYTWNSISSVFEMPELH